MKLSLILMCWNTSHLLERTMHTLAQQTLDDWELIVVDDMSQDDVEAVFDRHELPVQKVYFRLHHDLGMRGNTASINHGVKSARGDVVMWSTPEVMLPPGALEAAYRTIQERPDDLLWVTVPSHGLSKELQPLIDTVDWRTDVHNIKKLVSDTPPDHWDSIWFHLNFYHGGNRDGSRRSQYGNNQTVAVDRAQWLEHIGSFPLFADYGTDDPWISGKRNSEGYEDVTLWDQEAYHQWHPPCQFWMALGCAPNWNANGHTIARLSDDDRVPEGGTCETWDKGSHDKLTDAQIRDMLSLANIVTDTGFRYKGGSSIISNVFRCSTDTFEAGDRVVVGEPGKEEMLMVVKQVSPGEIAVVRVPLQAKNSDTLEWVASASDDGPSQAH